MDQDKSSIHDKIDSLTATNEAANTTDASYHKTHDASIPLIIPTMSSIMKDRLSNYQNGQLAHLNWIVSQYLPPVQQQQKEEQQEQSSSLASSKRPRNILEAQHRHNNDRNSNSEPQDQDQSKERRIHRNNDNNNNNNGVGNHLEENTDSDSTLKGTAEYKKARQILNQYVDRMKGGNSITLQRQMYHHQIPPSMNDSKKDK